MKNTQVGRPPRLAYQALSGIVEVHVPLSTESYRFDDFVDNALNWAGTTAERYCILDTFLSDTLRETDIARLLHHASEKVPVRIALLNPFSAFAEARAASLGNGTSLSRSLSGLKKILRGIYQVQGRDDSEVDGLDRDATIAAIQSNAESVHLALKEYDVVPSGPFFFFNDLLLAGRYAAGTTSRNLPWTLIVDEPHEPDDYYDICFREFRYIWNEKSNRLAGQCGTIKEKRFVNHTYFLSYSHEDETFADHIETLLLRKGRRIIRDEQNIRAGETLSEELTKLVSCCDSFLALYSDSYRLKSWCKHELDFALNLKDSNKVNRVCLLSLSSTRPDSMRTSSLVYLPCSTRQERELAVARLINEE